MKRVVIYPVLLCGASFLTGGAVLAHESFMDCFDNQNETVTCVAGYVDGSPPSDRDRVLLKDADGKTLVTGHFDADGNYTFDKPGNDHFMVIFMGAEIGHTLRVDSVDLISRR